MRAACSMVECGMRCHVSSDGVCVIGGVDMQQTMTRCSFGCSASCDLYVFARLTHNLLIQHPRNAKLMFVDAAIHERLIARPRVVERAGDCLPMPR